MADTEKQMAKREEATPERAESGPVFVPQVDIIEREDSLVVLADVPGTKPEDLDIDVEKGVLTLRAQVKPCECEGYQTIYSEYAQGSYERTFSLGREIDQSSIEAEMKNGVLKLVLPKVKEAQARKIQVKGE